MASKDSVSEYDWEQYTIKQLNRTLLFDTDTAIRFVRELGEKREASNTAGNSTEDAKNCCLTGTEAKTFYESIVTSTSTPCDKVHEEIDVRPCKSPKKRKSVKKSCKPSSIPTIADLFIYAQNGHLSQLSTALSTGCFDINMTDHFDWTLLMTAATAGHMTTVQYLLNEGAEWAGLVDKKKMDAVDLARVSGHPDIARYILKHSTQYKEQQYEQVSQQECTTPSSFLCNVCNQVIQNTPTSSHSVSIAHQFSCQHPSPSVPYGLPLSNKGYQMMVRGGWDPERGLGSEGQGRRYPVKTVLKRDRLGVGVSESAHVPRVTHFRPGDVSAVKSARDWRRVKNNDKGGDGPKNKKEREKKLRKERRWEIGMRQYMSIDY